MYCQYVVGRSGDRAFIRFLTECRTTNPSRTRDKAVVIFSKGTFGVMIKQHMAGSLFRSAGIYTLASGINSAIPFFLMPILTRYMTPEDYGKVAMFGVLVSCVTPFIGLNIHGAIARQYYEQDSIDIRIYITNTLFILFVSSTLVAVCLYFGATVISQVSSFPGQLLWMVITVAVAQFISLIVLTLWQLQVKPFHYGIYQIAQTSINAGLSIQFVVRAGLTWKGRIEAQVYTFSVFALIGLVILLKQRWLKWSFCREYIVHALRFGIPLIPHTLGGMIITMTDRFFITYMVGIGNTGLYAVGYSIGSIIELVASAFNKAYVPWLFAKLKQNNLSEKRTIVKFTYMYFACILILASSLSLFAPWFLRFFLGRAFTDSSRFVMWIALGYAFNGMYYMVVNYIFYAQKTIILAKVTFFTSILNIGLNYGFIKYNGAIGAAQATTLTFLIGFLFTWILSNKAYTMPWWEVLKDIL